MFAPKILRDRRSLTNAALPICSLILLTTSIAEASPWLTLSDPARILPWDYTSTLEVLPTSAELPEASRPWSGPYWRNSKGSISYEWQSNKKPWKKEKPTQENIFSMSAEEIRDLSPSIKLDIANGNYDLPHYDEVNAFAKATPSGGRIKSWYGICVGWAQAAFHYDEPLPVTYRNSDGLLVEFGSGDLKALASYYYANNETGPNDEMAAAIAEPCEKIHLTGAQAFDVQSITNAKLVKKIVCGRDLNAGALHLVLANRIGLQKKNLIGDFSPKMPVNQHPIFGYHSEFLGERNPSKGASSLAVREVRVRTRIHYAKYAPATWEAIGTIEGKRRLNYWLEIDAEGRIVGGNYTGLFGGKVPDKLWTATPIQFSGRYELLNELLKLRIPLSN